MLLKKLETRFHGKWIRRVTNSNDGCNGSKIITEYKWIISGDGWETRVSSVEKRPFWKFQIILSFISIFFPWKCFSPLKEVGCLLTSSLTWTSILFSSGSDMATESPIITPFPGAKLYRLTATQLEFLSVRQNVLKKKRKRKKYYFMWNWNVWNNLFSFIIQKRGVNLCLSLT